MPCYHPIPGFRTPHGVVFSERRAHDILGDIQVACGQCVGCRLERSRQWSLRVIHEASLYRENCFLTLTYDDAHLPPDNSLRYSDVQLFLKRLRKFLAPKAIRYYLCGEYGSQTNRPHYHICLFNHRFSDQTLWQKTSADSFIYSSPSLDKLWPHGHSSIGELNVQTAAYTARYVMQKITGHQAKHHYTTVDQDGVLTSRTPEFNRMSTRPGIGAQWFHHFLTDVYPHDYVVHDGSKSRPPKYYDKLLKRHDQSLKEEIDYSRHLKALPLKPDNTEPRLAIKEEVTRARIRNLKREL